MHKDKQTHVPLLSDESPRGFSKYVAGGCIATVLIVIALGWSAWSYAKTYDGLIAPNVFVGSIDVGRKTPEEARMILQKRADELVNFLSLRASARILSSMHTWTLTKLLRILK